jgi:plasmid stability protein
MKSITMHKLDPLVANELERRARAQGRSLNSTAQDLLRSALGLSGAKEMDRTDAFKDLCGTWSEEELREFQERTADLDRVDSSEWQG